MSSERLIEGYLPPVREDGFNTARPARFKSTASFADGTAVTAGGAQGLNFGSESGPGIYWGSGEPSVSAAQGSIYIRTDGSSTSTRLYINSNGSTTWVAVTTAS